MTSVARRHWEQGLKRPCLVEPDAARLVVVGVLQTWDTSLLAPHRKHRSPHLPLPHRLYTVLKARLLEPESRSPRWVTASHGE